MNYEGRIFCYKAYGRFHSFMEPLVFDASASDQESGITVEAKHYDNDQKAIGHAVEKLKGKLQEKGIIWGLDLTFHWKPWILKDWTAGSLGAWLVGSWGTRDPPLVGLLLSKQPTIFRWRKRHDNIFAIKAIVEKPTFLKFVFL